MDLADVAGAIDAQIIVGGKQLAADDPAHDRGQTPEEMEHRRVVVAVDLEGRAGEQSGVTGCTADRDRRRPDVRLQILEEGLSDLHRDQTLEMGIAVVMVAAEHLHARQR
jgi:hypothetical protein